MYKKDDYLVYKKDVCIVKEIKHNDIAGLDYYVLNPVNDKSLTINVPIDNKMGWIRDIISKEEAEQFINNIPKIEPLKNINDKYIESTYKDLILNGTREDLVRIIKTAYIRNEERINNKRKICDKDSNYFNKAERYLYSELSIALNMSFDEIKTYIIKRIKEIN